MSKNAKLKPKKNTKKNKNSPNRKQKIYTIAATTAAAKAATNENKNKNSHWTCLRRRCQCCLLLCSKIANTHTVRQAHTSHTQTHTHSPIYSGTAKLAAWGEQFMQNSLNKFHRHRNNCSDCNSSNSDNNNCCSGDYSGNWLRETLTTNLQS